MSTEDLYEDLDPIREPEIAYLRTTQLMKKHFGYNNPRILGEGSFGSVIRFNHPENEDGVAVKLLYLKEVNEGLPYDLMKAVTSNEYLQNPESLNQLKLWLHQVLCGLDYLHYKDLCHLDMKSDNVLISRRASKAMIADFTFLNRTTSCIGSDDIGLPIMYQPPEAFRVLKKGESIDGRAFDLWTYGLMSFEVLSNFHMVRSFACRHLGAELRHASIRGALMEEAFTDKIKTALPAVEITYEDVKLALDFIHSFLKSDPSARITAETGMKHKFLGQGDFVCNDVDALWQRPNPTTESIYGPTIYHHQIEAPTIRRRQMARTLSLREGLVDGSDSPWTNHIREILPRFQLFEVEFLDETKLEKIELVRN
ncbi:putative cyclin-dependent like protein [Argiope bruennichi]|uniref:Putative cyclin-dependent like protein n=1 Tax=Argiope bruennichi TaxID=94029 RepID=A0A8T0EMD0_ARGBR|nr:putative cyclin-dependent like protein [Argiope bruennichi]